MATHSEEANVILAWIDALIGNVRRLPRVQAAGDAGWVQVPEAM